MQSPTQASPFGQGRCVLKLPNFAKNNKMLKSNTNLLEYLALIEDPRRKQGQRHELKNILLISLMSIMSGYIGYRATGDFMKRNKKDLLLTLKPKSGKLPSFDVIRQVLIHINFEHFSKQFHDWAMKYVKIKPSEWLSLDGKAIGGTVTNSQSSHQNFVSLVSLYCSKRGLILGNAQVINSKQSEISVVQKLIESLDLKGVFFSLDALHCQKKLQPLL